MADASLTFERHWRLEAALTGTLEAYLHEFGHGLKSMVTFGTLLRDGHIPVQVVCKAFGNNHLRTPPLH